MKPREGGQQQREEKSFEPPFLPPKKLIGFIYLFISSKETGVNYLRLLPPSWTDDTRGGRKLVGLAEIYYILRIFHVGAFCLCLFYGTRKTFL
jgi:hypothetical protein